MLLTANSLMCCDPVKFIFKAKPLTNHMTENIISSSIITNKSSNLCFNAILNKNQLKHLPLICTTLTRYHTKGNQEVPVFILDIDKASTDSKEKGMTQRGPDVHSKVNICLCRLKYSSYNILTISKVFKNPGCNH